MLREVKGGIWGGRVEDAMSALFEGGFKLL